MDGIGILARPPFVVEELRRPAELLQRLESDPFSMIIAWMPCEGIDIEDILPIVRSKTSPSSRCILILLTEESRLEERRAFLSMGLNALLPSSASQEELDAAIARQTQVAPRVGTRVLVRLKVNLNHSCQAVICQTVNFSHSGMFIASTVLPPVGTTLSFEITLPGRPVPISGEGSVVRHAATGRGEYKGLGVLFTTFRQDGWQILRKFIEEQLTRSGRPPHQNG